MVCGIACRTRVPRTAAVDVYMKRKLFVPKGIRCCAGHLTSDNKLDSSSIEKIQRSNDVQLEGEEVESFLDEMCEVTQCQIQDLEPSGLHSNHDCQTFTGYSKQQLIEIEKQYIQGLRNTDSRSKLTVLGVYLTKLRTRMTNKQMAALIKLNEWEVNLAVSELVMN